MLVDHRVDDVHKRLIAREEAVPAREQIAFEPSLALRTYGHTILPKNSTDLT
jgi:hypothetical protein